MTLIAKGSAPTKGPIITKPVALKTHKNHTIRQRLVAQKLSEILRNKREFKGMTLGKILLDAGYSKATSLHPKTVTTTKGFKMLLDEYLPGDTLLSAHQDLLNASQLNNYVFSPQLTDKEIGQVISKIPAAKLVKIQRNSTSARAYFVFPDNRSRKEAIDMGYKLRGAYAAEKIKLEDDTANLSDEELLQRVVSDSKYASKLKELLNENATNRR